MTGDPVERPADFDLEQAWRAITGEVDRLRTPVTLRALVDPEVVWRCRMTWGTRLEVGPAADDGRVPLEVRGHSHESLAAELAGFGAQVVVVDPPEVQTHLARIGRELIATYASHRTGRTHRAEGRSDKAPSDLRLRADCGGPT